MVAIPGTVPSLSKAQVEAALSSLSPPDWQRARSLANGMCAGLAGWSADDLLQEAMASLLGGERSWPNQTAPLVVLKVVMRSIASNARKQEKNGPIDVNAILDPAEPYIDDSNVVAPPQSTLTPEDELSGKQQLVAIYAAVAGDADLEELVVAWADGVRGGQACAELGWNEKKYDAVRKRLLRRLEALDPERRKS